MALGALAFDPSSPGDLVIPEVTFVSDDGASWITVVGTGPLEIPDLPMLASRLAPKQSRASRAGRASRTRPWPTGSAVPDVAGGTTLLESGDVAFVDAVKAALGEIDAGRLQKVVLARKVVVDFDKPVDVTRNRCRSAPPRAFEHNLLRHLAGARLRRSEPGAAGRTRRAGGEIRSRSQGRCG